MSLVERITWTRCSRVRPLGRGTLRRYLPDRVVSIRRAIRGGATLKLTCWTNSVRETRVTEREPRSRTLRDRMVRTRSKNGCTRSSGQAGSGREPKQQLNLGASKAKRAGVFGESGRQAKPVTAASNSHLRIERLKYRWNFRSRLIIERHRTTHERSPTHY
jgi:hypothetical protein